MTRRRAERRFTKIKFDGRKTRLEWQITRPSGGEPDEYLLACNDLPLPSFGEALQALIPDVLAICEFPSGEASKFLMRGVSLSYDESGVMGACLTALRSLMTADAPLIINSPFLPEQPRQSDPSGYRLAVGTVRRLKMLVAEAGCYLDGDRAYDGGRRRLRKKGAKS